MCKFYFKLAFMFLFAAGVTAARGQDLDSLHVEPAATLYDYLLEDTIESMDFSLDGKFELHRNMDEDLYRLFVPLTYYNSVFRDLYGFSEPDYDFVKPRRLEMPLDSAITEGMKIYSEYTGFMKRFTGQALMNMYINRPDLVVMTEDELAKYNPFDKNVVNETPPQVKAVSFFTPESPRVRDGEVTNEISLKKPNFWKFMGNGSIQLSQNKFSDNWNYEGESSAYILSDLLLNINYNDQRRIEFDNKVEVKLGLTSLASDTVRRYNTSSDLLRLTSKFGIKAFSKWYYSVSAEFSTQMLNTYEKNSDVVKSAFMAPANVSVNVGMDYKLSKEKVTLSLMLSPLSYLMKYVGNDKVDKTSSSIGIAPDRNSLHNAGSKILFNMTWTIIPQIIWTSRLDYFTSYKKIEARCENTFDFKLNRYLSAKLFVDLRYNDKDKDAGYKLQYNEMFSFGINYTW